jgi:hypothetical protein
MTFEDAPPQRMVCRMTIRGLMVAILIVALFGGEWAYLEVWQARRSALYRQRHVTRMVISAANDESAAGGQSSPWLWIETGRAADGSHWTLRLEARRERDGLELIPAAHAAVSSANDWLSLQPIIIETDGTALGDALVDRLVSSYRARGWRNQVIVHRNPSPAALQAGAR